MSPHRMLYLIHPLQSKDMNGLGPGWRVTEVADLSALRGTTCPDPGVVVFRGSSSGVAAAMDFAEDLGDESGWLFVLAPGEMRVDVDLIGRVPEGPGDEVRRLRHAVNNALTPALAELQMTLMDEVDPELRKSLSTVQTSLRVIRDVVAGQVRRGAVPSEGAA